MRGPGITAGSVLTAPATPVDLAPTFLAIAGLEATQMDGRSILPLLISSDALDTLDGRDVGGAIVRPAALDPWAATHAAALDNSFDATAGNTAQARLHHLAPPARSQLRRSGSSAEYATNWREAVLLEHLYVRDKFTCTTTTIDHSALCPTNVKCFGNCSFDVGRGGDSFGTIGALGGYPEADMWCADLRQRQGCWGTLQSRAQPPACSSDCYATEDRANNFIALRRVYRKGKEANALFAEFVTGDQEYEDVDFDASQSFIEYYRMDDDPEQLTNLHLHEAQRVWPDARPTLRAWYGCSGRSCP